MATLTKNSQFVKFTPWLKASAALSQGNKRKTMEDRIAISKFVYERKGRLKTFYVFLVLDGHSGVVSADFVKDNFVKIMEKHVVKQKGHNIRETIRNTFLEIDSNVKDFDSGTTASLLLVIDSNNGKVPQFWIANVGDSTIFGFDDKSGARKLSMDHNVQMKSERDRILKDEKYSIHNGYVALEDGNMIAMTRSLGDGIFGKNILPDPTIKRLKKKYTIFALASDGVWDVLSSRQMMEILNPPKERKHWRAVAQRLIDFRNSTFEQHDNSSIIIVMIDHERKYNPTETRSVSSSLDSPSAEPSDSPTAQPTAEPSTITN